MPRKLRVFLCHASEDKPAVRELYQRLAAESWIESWLDDENILPGQDWKLEINKAAREADVIIICMSKISVAKEGYLNKEIRRILEISDEKLEGEINIIPLRLDECKPSFERLKQIHYADYFKPKAHERLLKSLRLRAGTLRSETPESKDEPSVEAKPTVAPDVELDLYRFIQIPPTEQVPYSFYIGKYPVTNAHYKRFLDAPDFANPVHWLEFPKFDGNCERIGDWGQEGWFWFQEELEKVKLKVLLPRFWNGDFELANPMFPVAGISWHEANAYCQWLLQHWDALSENDANLPLKPQTIRLPLETEWVSAAGGDKPKGRYPWDEVGKETTSLKEILRRTNVMESRIRGNTAVNAYPLGQSLYGVMDMAGNVWEWQANCSGGYTGETAVGLRGGSWNMAEGKACVSLRVASYPDVRNDGSGFRLVLLPIGESL